MGYPAEQTVVPNSQWMGSVVDEDRPRLEAAINSSAKSDEPFDFTFRIQLQNGAERWLHSSAGVTRDEAEWAARLPLSENASHAMFARAKKRREGPDPL